MFGLMEHPVFSFKRRERNLFWYLINELLVFDATFSIAGRASIGGSAYLPVLTLSFPLTAGFAHAFDHFFSHTGRAYIFLGLLSHNEHLLLGLKR
jgi:hypothetical protein